MSTGHYSICMLQTPSESKRKERSPKLSEQFEKLLEAKTNMEEQEEDNNEVEEDEEEDNDTNDENESTTGLKYKDNNGNDKKNNNKKEQQKKMTATESSTTLTQDIIQACILWQSLPSSLSGLPSIFEPVQFNPFPDHIPLDDDLKAPAQLLDPLIIERQALCLPSEGFHLLKNLTGDILLSHTQPSCHHVKPDDPSPTDLELERQVLNDDLEVITNQVLAVMDKRLMASWQPLLDFLYQLEHLEEQRDTLMGKQCQATVDAFVEKQQLIPFTQYWQQFISRHNNKKKNQVNEEALHHMINTYLDTLVQHVQSFLDDFVKPRLEQIGQLIQNLWDLVGPTIQHMAERMATHEERDKGNAENCRAVSQSLKGLHSSKEVDEAIDRIQHAMADRVNEYINSVQQLKQSYISVSDSNSSSPSTKSALFEKFTQKDFKKKVKRLETGYTSLRQFFRYEVSQKIFPETLFCKFSLVCLGALMQEGEVMEAMIIETEVKRFIETHRLLVKRRQAIILQYEEGVQVGRRELAGILGKLFLKEGMRIQGENLALKRQNMLLKSMGVNDSNNGHKSTSDTTTKKKKKNKKNKNKPVTTTSTDSQKEREQCHRIEDSETKCQDKEDDGTTAIIQPNPLSKQQSDQEQIVLSTSTSTSSSVTITTPSSPLQLPPPLPSTITSQNQKLEPPTIKKKNKVLIIPASTPTTSPSTSSTETAVSNAKDRTVTIKPNISAKTKILKTISSKPATTQSTLSKNSINPSTITTKSTTSEATDDIPDRKSKDIGINTTGTTLGVNNHNNSEKNKVDDSLKEVNINALSSLTSATSNDIIKATGSSHVIEESEEKKQQIQNHIDMIKQLQQDKQELETKIMTLQQEMVNMEQHYAEKLKQQQQQAWQLYEQQQKENKELHRYVQQLESQIKLTPQQSSLPIKNNISNGILSTINSTTSSLTSSSSPLGGSHIYNHNFYQQPSLNSSSSHWLSTGFGNQDLFAGYRQEMQSSTPTSFHPPAL
ncbi:unnamed protein product [Cunninghamella echinulata]